MFMKRLIIGLVGALVWGIFSHTVSGQSDFLSNLLSGLSNFLFFVVGAFSDLIIARPNGDTTPNTIQIQPSFPLTFAQTFIRSAVSIGLFMLVTIVVKDAAIFSVDQMINISEAKFSDDGYRDIQTYFTGYISIFTILILMGYFFHLGSLHGSAKFFPLLLGCGASMGLVMILYLLYGAFLPIQILNYIQIEIPSVVSRFGSVIIKIIGWILTAAIDAFSTIALSVILWLSAQLGALSTRKSRRQLIEPTTSKAP